MKLQGLTIDQINFKLKQGYASKEDAEEAVRWWNENRASTVATLVTISHPDSRHPYAYVQIIISEG